MCNEVWFDLLLLLRTTHSFKIQNGWTYHQWPLLVNFYWAPFIKKEIPMPSNSLCGLDQTFFYGGNTEFGVLTASRPPVLSYLYSLICPSFKQSLKPRGSILLHLVAMLTLFSNTYISISVHKTDIMHKELSVPSVAEDCAWWASRGRALIMTCTFWPVCSP